MWQRAAEAGEPHSQNLLGLAYVQGKWGVDRDPQVAVSWFERAAAQSDRDALVNQQRRNHQPDAQDDAKFLAQCKSDQDQRKQAGKAAPTLRLQHKSTYRGGNDSALACEPHFVVTTDNLSEIANLRVTLELKNDQGATTQRTLAFSPFGMNTMNEGLDGRAWDSFSSSTLLPMKTQEFCEFQADYRITKATALVNGRQADLIAEGMFAK